MNDNALKSNSLLKHSEYRIIGVLGQGGFGITYEAEQVSLGRKVAVKEFFMKDYCDREDGSSHVTLSTSSSSRELVERFRAKFVREARMIAALDHEHIVKIYDVFEENGTAYYVMEYIGGGCLGEGVKAGKTMPEGEALENIRQIASALEYLHNKGIIHFDVKPSNVLRTEDGKLKLIDFGISKHYDEAGVQTSSTPVGISKGYAPLEQYQQGSDIKSFTPATDIYALGATLYALLSGANPPEASIVNEDGVPTIEGISPVVMHAIEKAMQPRRKDRPQSIREFIDLLDGKAEDDEETVVPSKPKDSVSANKPKEIFTDKVQQEHKEEKKQKKSFAKYGLIGGIAIIAILSVILFLNRGGQLEPVDSMMIDGTAECVSEFESAGAEREFKIEKNFEEKWTYTRVPEWCSVKAEDGKIVLSVTENKTEEARIATVEFRKKDGTEVLAKLTVNQTAKVAVEQQQTAEKVYGSVKISSTPSGASIWIDGKDTKKITPEIIDEMSLGRHIVTLKMSGYEDWSKYFSIKGSEYETINTSLVKLDGTESTEHKEDHHMVTQGVPQPISSNETIPSATSSSITGINNGHEWVDLGLSVKWATCNVGAINPEGFGDYYAWGETETKTNYKWANLKFCNDSKGYDFSKYVNDSTFGNPDNITQLELCDDVAHLKWGSSWRIPTRAEQKEMLNNCVREWTTVNGVYGCKFTSKKNGASIFMPAAGYNTGTKASLVGEHGYYWSSSLNSTYAFSAYFMYFNSGRSDMDRYQRYYGLTVRPVCK